MIKKLLCKMGFHKWVEVGTSKTCLDSLKQCERCKTGSMFYSFGMMEGIIPPSKMKEYWESGKIKNQAAYETIYGNG